MRTYLPKVVNFCPPALTSFEFLLQQLSSLSRLNHHIWARRGTRAYTAAAAARVVDTLAYGGPGPSAAVRHVHRLGGRNFAGPGLRVC